MSPVAIPAPVLALDLGGTQIRAAVVGPDGSRMARTAGATPTAQGPQAVVRACAAALSAVRAAVPAEVAARLAGIGISSPGPVDPYRGVVVEPPNLGPRFRDIPLAAEMEAALGLPAYLDRDTNVAILAERAFGAARGEDDTVYLTISTGIGGAIVTGGRLLHGPDGLAGELGHIPVALDGPRCGCGGIGHLEAFAAGVALAREARAAAATRSSPYLGARASEVGPEALSARDVAAGDEAADPTCVALMARARRAVAVACVGIANAFNPHLIVIGGAIAEGQGERLLGTVRDALATEVFAAVGGRVRVSAPGLGPDVSLAGAQPVVSSRHGDDSWRGGRTPVTGGTRAGSPRSAHRRSKEVAIT